MLHPGSRCGYVFGLVLSVIVFVLPSFFLKEGEHLFVSSDVSTLVAVMFGYVFCAYNGQGCTCI